MDADIKNLIRIGTVHSVDETKKIARVKFDDKGGIISGELKIINRTSEYIPKVGDMVLCIFLAESDGDGFVLGKVE